MSALPQPNEAYGLLSSNVEQQAFFGRLGQYGINPQSEKEASELYQMGAKLEAAGLTGPASEQPADSPITKAAEQLDQLLGRTPQGRQNAEAQRNQAIKSAADQLMEDPETYNAVLALKQAQADQLAQQLSQQNS